MAAGLGSGYIDGRGWRFRADKGAQEGFWGSGYRERFTVWKFIKMDPFLYKKQFAKTMWPAQTKSRASESRF